MEVDDDDNVMELSVPIDDDNNDSLLVEAVRLRRWISKSVHTQMVTHVLWPRKLPSKDVSGTEHETAMVALMLDTLESIEKTNECVASSSKLFLGLFNTNTSPSAQIIASEINRLKVGDMFGYFVKKQNCGISVYIPPSADGSAIQPTSAIVSTFPVVIPNDEIYAVGVEHSEFQMELPNQSVKVGFSAMLNSEVFSQQLHYLNSNEMTSKPDDNHSYVSQWLVPLLSTHRDSIVRQADFPIISKKIRDDVVGQKQQQNTQFFRRSAYWTFMKAILQLNLAIECGDINGKIMYKLVMLKVIAILCNYYATQMYAAMDVDVVSHLLAKLARRIEKMNEYISLLDEEQPNKFESMPDGFEDTYNTVIDEVKLVIFKVKSRLDQQIGEIQKNEEERCKLSPLSELNFEADVRQQLPNLRKYLATRQVPPQLQACGDKLVVKGYKRHYIDSDDAPDAAVFDSLKDPADIGIFLCDFENWILYALYDAQKCTPETLRSLSFGYSRLAERHYKGDPLGFSRMVLTQMKILTLMDRIAIDEHKLLKYHRVGINPDIFDNLLLPQYEDLEVAHSLKKYFQKRSVALYPSLIEEDKVTTQSFSVRFAEENEDMQDIIRSVRETTDAVVAKLELEYQARKKEVEVLRTKADQMSCEYFLNSNGKREHKDSCPACKLNRKISNVRVSTYEPPLPERNEEKNAIAFELLIPVEIACLRDVLCGIVLLMSEPTKKMRIFEEWIAANGIEEFNQSSSELVFLGTTVKGQLFGRTRTRGVHPDEPFDSCTLQNNRTCTLHACINGEPKRIPPGIECQSLKKWATFTVEEGSPYECLQWTVVGTSHTQNEVIARQFECPQNLTLCEFKNFGSLRADGHRLQLRKLYAMIETESLSFETHSVQALILQTLWEVGPNNPRSETMSESHEDYMDPKFAGAMIDLIDKFINTQKCNWKNPLKLLMTAVIAVRVFELNDDDNVADRTVQLLVKLRDIAYDWMVKVQTAMHETPANGTQADVEKLRTNLVEIAIAGALTFFVNFRHQHFDKIFIGSIMNSMTAVRFWLEFVVTINSNILMSDKQEASKSASKVNQEMFQRLIEHIGVQIESKVEKVIVNDADDLFEFVKSQWIRSRDANFQLKLDRKHRETVIISATIDAEEHFVQIGIITGEFLVNNLPVSRLPKTITEHPVYQRVFDKFIFEVQEAHGRFDTKYKYKGSYYSFYADDTRVIVTERKENGDEYELIPEDIFGEEIPYLLVVHHSHWWCKTKNVIEFRPIAFSDANMSSAEGVQYELDLNDGTLLHKKTKKIMVDVTSDSYQKIVKQLSRLESKRYIHVFMEEPRKAKIELVRMNIKFIVDATDPQESYDVVSNEFNGMTVAIEQSCETLYGLRHGLLLESTRKKGPTQKKLLILPHGKISARIAGVHEAVEISVESSLRSPPFFIYQIDEICRQLKASNRSYSAWLYLAYLHALTSHGLPDPFTEMTGTERSLQILQSAFVWSPAPYDEEALLTLNLIKKLAPNREIKNNLQFSRWPDFIDTHAAHDGFVVIANKLIDDSKRLEGLHPKTNQTTTTEEKTSTGSHNETNLDTSVREYFRCLPYFPNLRLSDDFIEHQVAVSEHYIHTEKGETLHTIRTISNLYHQNGFISPKSFSVADYLTKSDDDLKGPRGVDNNEPILHLYSSKNVRSEWLSLYNVARSGQFSRGKLALVLGLLAYQTTNVDDLNALLLIQTVAANQTIFNRLDPPEVRTFYLNDRSFNLTSIENILGDHVSKHEGGRYNEMSHYQYVTRRGEYIHKVATKIRDMWPCDLLDSSIYQYTHPNANLRDAVPRINKKLSHWRNIERLMKFLQKVDIEARRLSTKMPNNKDELLPWIPERLLFKHLTKFYVNFDAKIVENLQQLEEEVFEPEQFFTQPGNLTAKDWWDVYKSKIAAPNDDQHLVDAGMYPRLALSLVLPKLLSPTQNPKLKAIICAVGVQIVFEQRKRRIASYARKPEMRAALDQEEKNEPHTNWLPHEYPEWLLFEIEQDLTIRPIQIEVAKRMIDPPEIGTKHSVMQLNMGEGKTAVIVPILAAILANGKQLCQVTVLKSLFATNAKELRQCLGGMLNRRLYTFPCRRDMPINKYAETIFSIYDECRRLKGVVLTLPEYRLSFQLKIYEAAVKDETECSKVLLQIHKWLNQHARNILDESDAILQPKYQLIYTLGDQLSLDGGAQRWTVIQELLKRLPSHLNKLWQQFGDEKIEFDSDYAKNGQVFGNKTIAFRPDVFTPCRILDNYVYEQRLKKMLIDDIVDGNFCNISCLVHATKQTLKLLLSEGDVTAERYGDLLKDLTMAQQTTVLIVSGFLRFNVLQLVLSKRWRVNYGVNENGPRKMAIPFKAKDVAAEMTEFGHPDVAICFTQLSYYYSGLSETQLHQVFKILESQQNSAEIYDGWINSVPTQLVDETIKSYTGVNLSDPKQRNELVFPLFKHNMHVIDYWLSNLVFPREAKTFEHKLMCTAWDLVSDNLRHTVSGFSGTNDTKNILPLPISQNDLKKLEQTNDNVRNILLRQENSGYYHLPANVRGHGILVMVSKMKIPVLLDSGACMLELNNEQVATKWLDLVDPMSFDATVYFNSNDVLMTVDRNGIRTEFDYSVYRNKLDRCLVYLDDVHTRGTDLKFPLGWKACVTLSGEITRDKTVQACMRMRLLGQGHSIVFMASYEAHMRIRHYCGLGRAVIPTSENVLAFICENSRRFEEENTVHWAAAAYNYAKKLAAHKVCDNSKQADATLTLHLKCRDNEYVTLKDMYGIKQSALLTAITKGQFDKITQAYQHNNEVIEMVDTIYARVSNKLSKQAPGLQRYTQTLEEEQEKELEHELEEQRQVERPLPATAMTPVYDEQLENIVRNGASSRTFREIRLQNRILTFDESLLDKSLYNAYKDDPSPWSGNLYVTRDFVNVVEGGQNSEEYLRPVWWIAQIERRTSDDIFLLLSSYETNYLLPYFRKSTKSTLMSYRPRLSQTHSNLLNEINLQVTAIKPNPNSVDRIGLDDEVQIAMYSGSMYFHNHVEQDAYCGFMGLIPNPRSVELEMAFEEGIITPNSYVPPENRRHSAAISRFVKKCKFDSNPVELAIKLIEAHHIFVRKESHVAAILEKATKKDIN